MRDYLPAALTRQPAYHSNDMNKIMAGIDIRSVIEIGSLIGASAIFFAEKPEIAQVYCVDPMYATPEDWASVVSGSGMDPLNYEPLFWENIREAGLEHKIKLFKGLSWEIADQVPHADMLYIDGNHSYEATLVDIKLYLPKARKLVIGDDYHLVNGRQAFPGVHRATKELVPDHQHDWHLWWKQI